MVGVVLSLIFPLTQPDPNMPLTTQRRWLGNLGMVGIGFYGGFIQIGVGFLLIALLFHGFREDLGKGKQAQSLRSHDLHNHSPTNVCLE